MAFASFWLGCALLTAAVFVCLYRMPDIWPPLVMALTLLSAYCFAVMFRLDEKS